MRGVMGEWKKAHAAAVRAAFDDSVTKDEFAKYRDRYWFAIRARERAFSKLERRMWGEARIIELRELATRGLTAQKISERMKVTRNAIISATNRYGIRLRGRDRYKTRRC